MAAWLPVALVAALAGFGMVAASVVPAGAALAARPDAVTGLSVQAGDAPGELHVSWDPHPQGAVDYRVKWARVGTNFKKISDTDWNAFPVDNELTISGLWPGESYKVQVRARFSGPNGKWSPVVTGTAAEVAPEPIKVTDLKLTDLSDQPAENSGPAYADAASVVWSATLTVGVDGSQPPGSGYSRWAGVGELSERGLTLGGTSMRVMLIVQLGGGLYLAMDRATDADFTLTLGDDEFIAGESLVPHTAGSGRYWWATDGDLWEAGEEVDASITAGSATLGERATAPPIAYFSQIPRLHDGTGPFTLRLNFDRELPVTAAALKDHALETVGGTVTGVSAVSDGSTQTWLITVQPDGPGDVTVSLPAEAACDEPGAVCTADGLMLHNQAQALVAGPFTDWDAAGQRTTSLASGSYHSCVIEADGTLTCWGANEKGQLDAPAGTYKAVAAGAIYSCAMATDDTIACWGYNTNGSIHPPAGTYAEFAVGQRHSCAIADDDTLACWGYNAWGQTLAPRGTYKAIDVGWEHSCAIATDSTLACWGYPDWGNVNPPAGTYQALASGDVHNCAIATDDTIACWGRNFEGQTDSPAGTYKAIDAGYHHTCAIATDDTIACWGKNNHGQADAPAGTYEAVFARMNNSCAIATDDTVTCWGDNRDGQNDAPAGAFETVAISWAHTCALEAGGDVVCWGFNRFAQTEPLTGTYRNLDVGNGHSCAIATDDTIACWGDNIYGQTDAPAGNYKTLTSDFYHSCAIADDDTIACWGDNSRGQINAPAGTYKALTVGDIHSCAITDRRHHRLLGRQHLRPEDRPGRHLQDARVRPVPQLRDRRPTTPSPAGETTATARPAPRQAPTRPSLQAGATVARSPPTTPSPAGETTPEGSATPRPVPTRPSP